MSISIACGNCNAKLNAPDHAAGKRVKCPKCASLLQLPAAEPEFEMVDDEPEPTSPPKPVRARPKPVVKRDPDDDDDDEEEEDERPKRKTRNRRDKDDDDDNDANEDYRPRKRTSASRKRPAKSKSSLPLVLGIGAGIMVLGGLAFGVFMLLNSSDATNNKNGGGGPGRQAQGAPIRQNQANLSENWVTVTKPAFTAKMAAMPDDQVLNQGAGPAAMTINISAARGRVADHGHVVMVFELSDALKNEVITPDSLTGVDKLLNASAQASGKITLGAESSVARIKSRSFTTVEQGKTLYGRGLAANGHFYMLIAGGTGLTEGDAFVQDFFNNFQPK